MIMSAGSSTAQVNYHQPAYHHRHHHHRHLPYVSDPIRAAPPAPSRTASTNTGSHVFAIDFIMNPCESDNEADDEEPMTPIASRPPTPASMASSPSPSPSQSAPPPSQSPRSSSGSLPARKTHSMYKTSSSSTSSSPPASSSSSSSSLLHERRDSMSSTSSKVSKRNYQRHDRTKIAKLLEIYYDQKQSVRVAAKMVDIPRATAGRYIQKEKATRAAANSTKKYAKHANK